MQSRFFGKFTLIMNRAPLSPIYIEPDHGSIAYRQPYLGT